MRVPPIHLAICIMLTFCACASPEQKVSEAVAAGDLERAEHVLRAEGALSASTEGLPPELLAARTQFELALIAETRQTLDLLRKQGDLAESIARAEEALLRVPWSQSLAELLEQSRRDQADFTEFSNAWRGKKPVLAYSIKESREFLAQGIRLRGAVLKDTELRQLAATACKTDADALDALSKDGIPANAAARMQEYLSSQQVLSWIGAEDATSLQDLLTRTARTMRGSDLDEIEAFVSAPLPQTSYGEWHSEASSSLALGSKRLFSTWFDDLVQSNHQSLGGGPKLSRVALLAHRSRTGWLSNSTAGAIWNDRATLLRDQGSLGLAAIYATAAQAISPDNASLTGTASALTEELRASSSIEADYSIEFGTAINPEYLGTIVPATWSAVSSIGDGPAWAPASGDKAPDILFTVVRADLVLPDFEGLNHVSSSYYSHQETVANPALAILESQINSQKWSVNSYKSAYESAVSSHNIYPTQWSLNNVNSAYTSYSIAVDRYNALIRQYNYTPTTISRPVYLPYEFSEGELRFGWRFSFEIRVGSKLERIQLDQVQNEFVRIGTHRLDRDESRRSDKGLSDDFSVEFMFSLLERSVTSSVVEAISRHPDELADGFSGAIGDVETSAMYALMIPISEVRDRVALSESALTTAASELRELLDKPAEWNVIQLAQGSTNRATDDASEFTCQIKSGWSGGSWSATQSGAIVSEDGYVLTCAHGLVGERHVALVQGRPEPIEARLLRIDRSSDVALLKLDLGGDSVPFGHVATAREFDSGDPMRAAGFPSAPTGGSGFTLSHGQFLGHSKATETHLILDLTVSSGSSGGPILNRDGQIVGVTLAVGAPSLGESTGVASSGFVAVAESAAAALKTLRVTQRAR